jgi:hypothetical protein
LTAPVTLQRLEEVARQSCQILDRHRGFQPVQPDLRAPLEPGNALILLAFAKSCVRLSR